MTKSPGRSRAVPLVIYICEILREIKMMILALVFLLILKLKFPKGKSIKTTVNGLLDIESIISLPLRINGTYMYHNFDNYFLL